MRIRWTGVIGAIAAAGALAWAVTPTAWAQSTVWRCGNEYTNQPGGRTDCKPVPNANVTIIQGPNRTPARVASPPARPATQARPTTPDASGGSRTVSPVVQRRRDADARSILDQELRRAQAHRIELESIYKDGQPDKIGGEARNYQKYLDRVADLKAQLERNQSDIEGIHRELDRLGQ